MLYYYRTYFDKDNLIIKDSTLNLGKNPIAEIFYGGTQENPQYSRYIFKFDESYIKSLYNDCYLGDLSQVAHTLKLKVSSLKGNFAGDCESSSYSLCISPIEQDWCEGCGYSLDCKEQCYKILPLECNASYSASNWFYANPSEPWAVEGIFDNLSNEPIACNRIDCNNITEQYIEFDLTSQVNKMLTGDTANYGFALHFDADFENFPEKDYRQITVYTNETNTFFKPFLETTYTKTIKDDRNSFLSGQNNNVYLNVNKHKSPVKLDSPPIVSLINPDGEQLLSSTTVCVSKGIYEASFNVDLEMQQCMGLYEDKWSEMFKNGLRLKDHSSFIEIKPLDEVFDYNDEIGFQKKYGFKLRGIRHKEIINKGDLRKIFVDATEFGQFNKTARVSEIYYKLFVKQGNFNLNVIDWSKTNYSICDNWFYLDTAWMLEQKYWLSLKIEHEGETIEYPEMLNFTVQ